MLEEVAAMRKYLIYIALLLAGCGGDEGSAFPFIQQAQFEHVPRIISLELITSTADYMEGGGSVVVIAEINHQDVGLDIQTLWIRMPDGTTLSFVESQTAETGTFSEGFVMSTEEIGAFNIEFWLVDKAGDASVHPTAEFTVIADLQSSDWTNRLSGLPYALGDVIWDGDAFIAVGSSGTVLTSADGITWVAIESGTGADLSAVAFYGTDIYAVGDEIILHSADHGASWTVKGRITEAVLQAVAVNSSQVVVGGYRWSWGTSITMLSEDRGDTWQAVDSWPNEDAHMNDLVFRDGLFVASTPSHEGLEAWVAVSSDGKLWNEIAVSDEGEWAVPHTIIHDGSQFVLAGLDGTVFTSPDGFNWTRLQTPVRQVFYTGAAWNGSKLVLAGASMCGGMWLCYEPFDVPLGLSSTDGGMTWELFNIDSNYESSGLAWGNGRFVSVGDRPEFDEEGAIYTAD